MKTILLTLSLFLIGSLSLQESTLFAAGERSGEKGQKQGQGKNNGQKGGQGRGQNADWNESEYSGRHSAKDIEMALYSKGFAWLSGSPADNEKLSIGKNAQFFGFVALRYQSGRVAKRGELGRAFHALASPEQRALILEAAKAEQEPLAAWWESRNQILRKLEHHLYTGEAFEQTEMQALALKFGWLNAEVALYEAKAYAVVEDLLTDEQWKQLRILRQNPGLAATGDMNKRVEIENGLSREIAAQYEDLFAKAFSWLTGSIDDNQIFPLGQPAQFFGFVSIRHKSGHGASRGKISKEFQQVLNSKQQTLVKKATNELDPLVGSFKAKRTEFLLEMQKLRKAPDAFSFERYKTLAYDLGLLEIQAATTEAQTYHRIRSSMTEEQNQAIMAIRSDYILDTKEMETLSASQRGAVIYNLCQSCHANPQIAPNLKNIFNGPIASIKGFDYSDGMKKAAEKNGHWNAETLDAFLARPSQFVPGTKMGFQGLLNQADRDALIEYLKSL